jgi:hypothetical protein
VSEWVFTPTKYNIVSPSRLAGLRPGGLKFLQIICFLCAVQVTYSPDMGEVQEYFLGSGGLINLYCSITGETMPGMTDAVAQVCYARLDLQCILVLSASRTRGSKTGKT